MKNIKLFSARSVLFILLLVSCVSKVQAQSDNKGVYNSTIDQINCAAIQFIHREQGRAEQANTMDCLSFESISKTIPENEAKTTGALCKSINDYKNKYKADKPLDAQLNTVIAFVNSKITAKKRKGNVDDFKANLEKIKKEAIDNAGGKPSADNHDGTATETTPKKPDASTASNDSSPAITEPAANTDQGKTKAKTDWLGLLSLLIALGALAIGYLAYTKAKKSNGSMGSNIDGSNNNDAAMKEIQQVEKRLRAEIEALKARTVGNGSEVPSSNMGYMAAQTPTPTAQAPIQEERHKPVETTIEKEEPNTHYHSEPKEIEKGEEEYQDKEEETIYEPEPETISHHQPEPTYTPPTPPAHETPTALFDEKPEPVVDLFATTTLKEDPNSANAYSAPVQHETQTLHEEPFMPEKEYEDGEAVPFYKFAGLPDTDGQFGLTSFTNDPIADSVYEIEMYEDVPNKAFFSILPNPEVIKKALQDPDTYLAPCCSYNDDPSGKHTIILVEEGMLRMEGNKWTIYEKAKINFE